MICNLCGQDRVFIKAHIIPRTFFVDSDDGGYPRKVLRAEPGSFPTKLPIGYYDSGILCGPCDGRIGAWDDYASTLFLKSIHHLTSIDEYPDAPALVSPEFDYAKLRLFCLSMLWRATISTHMAFAEVQLGPHQARLKDLVAREDPGAPEEFSVLLGLFKVDGIVPAQNLGMLEPQKERWKGLNAYRFSLGTVTAYIKVDKRPFGFPFSELILRPGKPLSFVSRDYALSPERKLALKIVNMPQNRNAYPRTNKAPDRHDV